MSTPNTSKVKWVLEKDLFASYAKVAEYQERDNIAAPVIALADLTGILCACCRAGLPYKDGYHSTHPKSRD